MHKALHPTDDAVRLYVSRKKEGGVLASIQESVDVYKYLKIKKLIK